MGWLLTESSAVVTVFVVACLAASAHVRRLVARLARRAVAQRARVIPLRPAPVLPPGRPIEQIATDARRLRARFHATRSGVSYAKSEAVRLAYDRVLGEGCDALDHSHLLDVLPVGEDLDIERARVERLLHIAGLSFGDAA